MFLGKADLRGLIQAPMIPPVQLSACEEFTDSGTNLADLRFVDRPLIDQLRKGWPSVALGIILAGGAYPILVAAISFVIEIISGGPPVPEIIASAIFLWLYASIAALVGLVWTNVFVVLTLPAVCLVTWSLRLRGSIVSCGAFWGGFVGCAAVLPIMFMIGSGADLFEILAIGPALTTILGQLGGAWGGRRAIQRSDWYELDLNRAAVTNAMEKPAGKESPANPGARFVKPKRFQFGIRHLMWSAVWISLSLSLLRLLGAPLQTALPILGGWIVYQAVTMWFGGYIIRRLRPRWAAWSDVPRGTTDRADAACAFHVEHAIGRSLPDDVTREVVSRETV